MINRERVKVHEKRERESERGTVGDKASAFTPSSFPIDHEPLFRRTIKSRFSVDVERIMTSMYSPPPFHSILVPYETSCIYPVNLIFDSTPGTHVKTILSKRIEFRHCIHRSNFRSIEYKIISQSRFPFFLSYLKFSLLSPFKCVKLEMYLTFKQNFNRLELLYDSYNKIKDTGRGREG